VRSKTPIPAPVRRVPPLTARGRCGPIVDSPNSPTDRPVKFSPSASSTVRVVTIGVRRQPDPRALPRPAKLPYQAHSPALQGLPQDFGSAVPVVWPGPTQEAPAFPEMEAWPLGFETRGFAQSLSPGHTLTTQVPNSCGRLALQRWLDPMRRARYEIAASWALCAPFVGNYRFSRGSPRT
jgi:hypothetical protein